MKTKKIRLIPILFCNLLISCNGLQETTPDSPSPTPLPAPTETVEPEASATPAAELTLRPTEAEIKPEATPTEAAAALTPTPILAPVPEANRACMYINYASAFPIVATNNYIIEFHYNDIISVANDSGHLYDLSLSQCIAVNGTDLSDPELWYFCGAFETDNIVYAHFNYLNQETVTPSLLIKIDLKENAAEPTCCIFSHNPEKHFQTCFTFTDEYIYYTETGITDGNTTTNIMRTDKNGENDSIFYKGVSGETIGYMTSDGNYLSYVITSLAGSNRLTSIDLATGQETLLSKVSPLDFLIAWNGCVFTSTQNGCLTYFDCSLGTTKSISYTNSSSISSGYPLTDGDNLYLPLISYSEDFATILLPLDLTEGVALEEIHLDDTYYYSIGMIDNYLFAENMDSYVIFDITVQN